MSTLPEHVSHLLWQQITIDAGREDHRGTAGKVPGIGRDYFLRRHRAQLLKVLRAEGTGKGRAAHAQLAQGRQILQRRTALPNGFVEQALRQGRRHQQAHRLRAGRLAEDGDVAWIAAELGNIRLHPFQGRDLVKQTEVAR